MMAVFIRELRESAKWAAMICGVLLVACVHEIRNPSPSLLYDLSRQATPFLSALAGLLMGVAQSLFEMKADNWAFAVHRPVERLRLFVAKCAAGLVLLYTALALPCVFTAAWAARPGNLAMPFQMRMVLPMAADILTAGCYYFAAMVLMLRRARWQGTRLLPMGLAVFGTVAINIFIGEFWQAVILILLIQAIGVTAAWGVFATNGESDGAPVTRAALGAMIYPGGLALCMFVVGFSTSFAAGGHWQYMQVDREGNIVVVKQSIVDGNRTFEFTDASGKKLPQYQHVDPDDPAYAGIFLRFNAYMIDTREVPWAVKKFEGDEYRNPLPGVVRLGSVAPPGVRLPFLSLYVVPDRSIEMFDPVSHRVVGRVGPGGFTPKDVMPAERFPGRPVNISTLGRGRVMAFDSIVYWIEMDQRRVRPVFTAANGDPVMSAVEFGTPADPVIAVTTRRQIHVLRPSGEEICAVPIDVEAAKYVFEPAMMPSNHHLLLQEHPFPFYPELPSRLLEYDTDGRLVRQTDYPKLPEFRSPKRIDTALFGTLFPIAAAPFCPTWVLDEVMDIRTVEFAPIFNSFMIGSAILTGAASWWIARRLGLGWQKMIAWTIGNALLGPAGIFVLMGLYSRRPSEVCRTCGVQRLIGPEPCAKCGAALSADVADGREIFEPADAFSVAQ